MKYERCGGFIIGVSSFGGETATGAWKYAGWKRLNYGFITDPLIQKNRPVQFQRANRLNAPVRPIRWSPTIAEIAT